MLGETGKPLFLSGGKPGAAEKLARHGPKASAVMSVPASASSSLLSVC